MIEKKMKMNARFIVGIAVFMLCLTVSWLCMAMTARAESVKFKSGQSYKITVKAGGENLDKELVFTIPARGVVSWTLVGNNISSIRILDKAGKQVWAGRPDYLKKSGKVTFPVGLQKGTYTAEVRREYYSDHYTLTATYKKNNYYEIENNNSFKKATELKVGKAYQAVFWDENSNGMTGDREDYYKVKLTKGKNYQIQFSNFIKLFKGNSYKVNFKLYAPNKRTIIYSYDSSYSMSHSTLPKNGRLTFTAGSTGWYYIRLTAAYAPAQPMAFKVKVVKR